MHLHEVLKSNHARSTSTTWLFGKLEDRIRRTSALHASLPQNFPHLISIYTEISASCTSRWREEEKCHSHTDELKDAVHWGNARVSMKDTEQRWLSHDTRTNTETELPFRERKRQRCRPTDRNTDRWGNLMWAGHHCGPPVGNPEKLIQGGRHVSE